MARNTTPRPLSRLIDELPDEWWAAGLAVSAPGEARLVAALKRGEARSRDLPAAIAARVVSRLDPAEQAAVIEGESRVTVLAAAGLDAGRSSEGGVSAERATDGPRLPAVFRGEVASVRAKLARQSSVQLPTVLAGLGALDADTAAAVLGDVVVKLSRYSWAGLLAASVRGEVNVEPELVVSVMSNACAGGHWYLDRAWHQLEPGVDPQRVVRFAAAFVRSGVALPRCEVVSARAEAIAEVAVGWDLDERRLVVGALAATGSGRIVELCAGMDWATRLSVALVCSDHASAGRLIEGLPRVAFETMESRTCWEVLERVGDHLEPEQVAALYRRVASQLGKGYGWSMVVAVLGHSEHSPSAAVVAEALGMCSASVRSALAGELASALSPGKTPRWGWWAGSLKVGDRLEGDVAVAAISGAGLGQRWRLLYEASERHPAARGVLAAEVVACFERHDLDDQAAAMFLSMLDGWAGELDELGEVAAMVGTNDSAP